MTQATATNGAPVNVYKDSKKKEFAFHAEFCEFTSNQDGDSFAVVIDGQGDVHIVFSHKISFNKTECENSDLASALKNLLSRVENDKDAKKWFLDEQRSARNALGRKENA